MNILEQAIHTYGKEKQEIVAIEEMSELQKELSKNIRGEENTDHISEEIADVEIMLEQLKIMHSNRDSVEDWKAKKIERLQRRLGAKNKSKVF